MSWSLKIRAPITQPVALPVESDEHRGADSTQKSAGTRKCPPCMGIEPSQKRPPLFQAADAIRGIVTR